MKQLEQIVQKLMINGTLTEQPGLFYGKTGIAVFFFHLARLTGNSVFQEYAMDLIEEVQKQISDKTSAQYDIGIAGIGVGFEYFLQNGFIEAEESDFFGDFDDRMYRAAMNEPYSGLSLEGGLTGRGRYFIYRLRGDGHKESKLHKALTHIAKFISKKINLNKVPEKERPDVYHFFQDITSIPEYAEQYANSLQQCWEWNCVREPLTHKLFPYMNNLQRLYACQNYFNRDLTEEIEKEWENRQESDINTFTETGLLNGWTAEGMLYMTFVHNLDKSWLNLL